MKVVCSFSLLLRLAFWLSVIALVTGAALGDRHGTASPGPIAPVVAAPGKEVQ